MTVHKVRTTMQPDKELLVDDAEYTDLFRQGVLLGVVGPPDDGDTEGAEYSKGDD